MIHTNTSYWFALKTHTYVAIQNNSMLLYNTLTGQCVESADALLIELVKQTQQKHNLGVCLFKPITWSNTSIQLMETILEMQLADIMLHDSMRRKPVRLVPILNLQRSVEKLQREHRLGERILANLTHLNIYLNGTCELNCQHCDTYYQQFTCCTKANDQLLSVTDFENILLQTTHAPIATINILGGNILLYPHLQHIITLGQNQQAQFHYWIHADHLLNYSNTFVLEQLQYKDLIVPANIGVEYFAKLVSQLGNHTQYHFIIESEDDYEKVNELIENYNLSEVDIIPFYNKANEDFFSTNIFVDKDDILSTVVSQKKIFRNQVLNANFFGSLTILSNRTVKASTTNKTLGDIHDNSILELLETEMRDNTAWRVTRDKAPCNTCLYQHLCSPISNYEQAFGRINLCNVSI